MTRNETAGPFELRAKRLLITGGAGFLGSHIVDAFRERGCGEIATPRRNEFDLTHREDVESLFQTCRPEVVIHAAAMVGGILANRDQPGRFFYENALMGLHVIEACRKFGVAKTVIIGTVCSYPAQTPVPFQEDDLWKGYPEATNAPYGIAKRALLTQCQAYRQQYGLNAIFVMPSNLYGPRDHFDPHTSHVVPALIRKFADAREEGAREVVLWGSGAPTRDFLYVEDAADALVAAAERYNGSSPVNIGSGDEISIGTVAEKIAGLLSFSGTIRWDTSQPNGQLRRRVSIERAQREFGFAPRTTLDAGLRATIEWYLQNVRGSKATPGIAGRGGGA